MIDSEIAEGNTTISFTDKDRTATIITSQAKIYRRLQRKGYLALRGDTFMVPKDAISYDRSRGNGTRRKQHRRTKLGRQHSRKNDSGRGYKD